MLDKLIQPLVEFSLATIQSLGYGGIFILMVLESANVPIPSEVIMPFAGFLASQGTFNLWIAVFLGALGNLAGSLFSYWLAVQWGEKAFGVLNKLRLYSNRDHERGKRWVSRHGQWAAFFSRMLPIVRTFVSFPAGMFRMKLVPFSVFTFVGSLIWSFFLASLGFAAGQNWESIRRYGHIADTAVLVCGLIGLVWWIVHKKQIKMKHDA